MNLIVKRVFNLIALAFSYLASRLLKNPVHRGLPAAISIEPFNGCNLACPECPAGMNDLTRPRGTMQPDLFRRIIDRLSPELAYLTLYFQGEPYLSPHFHDFTAYARLKKIFVTASTNGHFLNEENVRKTITSGLNRLIVSVDGPDQESYESYRRGGNLEKVKEGLRQLAAEKKRRHSNHPQVVIQCLLLRTNENRIDEIRKLAAGVGADKVEFKTAQFLDFEHGNPLMPETERFSRYRRDRSSGRETRYVIKNPLNNACFRMWSSCVITHDGKVVPCCYDKDADHVMGDINEQSFQDIWRGEKYDTFRRQVLTNRKSIKICTNCDQKI